MELFGQVLHHKMTKFRGGFVKKWADVVRVVLSAQKIRACLCIRLPYSLEKKYAA